MIVFVDVPPAPTEARGEWRGSDGRWPVCRPDMRDGNAVVARMGLDFLRLYDEHARVDEDALVRMGWPRVVVRERGESARAAFLRLRAARDGVLNHGMAVAA